MEIKEFNISLLYVEDEHEARMGISEMLAWRVSKLYVAENAQKALEIFKTHKIDLLISDIKMPGINGLEMAEKMNKSNPRLKIIMMSAVTDTHYLLKAIDLHIDSYIIKPVRKQKLFSAIKKQTDIIISEKIILEQDIALKQSEKKYKNIFDNTLVSIFTYNTKNEFTDTNQAGVQLLGYTKEELTKLKISNVADNKEVVLPAYKKLKNGDKLINFEHKLLRKDGKIITVLNNSIPSSNQYGDIIGMQSFLFDISDKKKAEHEIQKQNIKLKELNATKDKFFSIIAHDLKSPFNTMLGFAKLLVDKFDQYDKQKQKKYLSLLNNDIINTYKLLENLLLWSRTQQGTIDFYPEKENLYLITRETIELLSPIAAKKAIELISHLPENINVHVDNNMLLVILRNLISNAIKFTSKKGKISIKAVTLTDNNKQKIVQISVKDSGVGMSKEKQKQLFNISKNHSTTGTEGETGTGLGLILCKEFIEKHGGKIWLESEIGKGSTFHFTLDLL